MRREANISIELRSFGASSSNRACYPKSSLIAKSAKLPSNFARAPGNDSLVRTDTLTMELRTTILWIHALAGAAWVAACVCFVIAGLALAAGSEEQRTFTLRAAPKIVAFNLTAAIVLLLTGGINLALAGEIRDFQFSSQFELLLSAKLALFVGMSIVLGWTLRAVGSLRNSGAPSPTEAVTTTTSRLVRAHGAIAAMGGCALLLGLWLMGAA